MSHEDQNAAIALLQEHHARLRTRPGAVGAVSAHKKQTQGMALFLLGSAKDIQLAMEIEPAARNAKIFDFGMHLFLESRYCVGSLYANADSIQYEQNNNTIVGIGLQKLALSMLSNVHLFPLKTIPELTLSNVQSLQSLDRCVGTLRSWGMYCDVDLSKKTSHKRRGSPGEASMKSMKYISSSGAPRCEREPRGRVKRWANPKPHTNTQLQQQTNIKPIKQRAVSVNESRHRITTPDITLYARFFDENRHFVSTAMMCLPPWMKSLENARGICLNAAALLCCADKSKPRQYYNAMNMQRVSVSTSVLKNLQMRWPENKHKVMTVKMNDGTTREVHAMHIEEQQVHQTLLKPLNMMLCCEDTSSPMRSTYVFMGDGLLLDGTRIHTAASACVSSDRLDKLDKLDKFNAQNTNDANEKPNSKESRRICPVKDVIHKMRYIQAAATTHEAIYRQLGPLLTHLKHEVLQVQKKTDSENSARLRMLYQSFGCGLHALVALRL